MTDHTIIELIQLCLTRKISVEIVRCGPYAKPGKPYLCRARQGEGINQVEHLVYGNDAEAVMREAMEHVLEKGFTETYDYGLG